MTSFRIHQNDQPVVDIDSGGSFTPLFSQFVKHKLSIRVKPRWRNVAAISEYTRDVPEVSSSQLGKALWTVEHPEDVLPGLLASDVEYQITTRWNQFRNNPAGSFGPNFIRQDFLYTRTFQIPAKSVLNGVDILSANFMHRVSKLGWNPLTPTFTLDPLNYVALDWDGILAGNTGTRLDCSFNQIPWEWRLEFQTDINPTFRNCSIQGSPSAHTERCTWGASPNEINQPQLNVTLRPYWALNPSIKGTPRTFLIT